MDTAHSSKTEDVVAILRMARSSRFVLTQALLQIAALVLGIGFFLMAMGVLPALARLALFSMPARRTVAAISGVPALSHVKLTPSQKWAFAPGAITRMAIALAGIGLGLYVIITFGLVQQNIVLQLIKP